MTNQGRTWGSSAVPPIWKFYLCCFLWCGSKKGNCIFMKAFYQRIRVHFSTMLQLFQLCLLTLDPYTNAMRHPVSENLFFSSNSCQSEDKNGLSLDFHKDLQANAYQSSQFYPCLESKNIFLFLKLLGIKKYLMFPW